MNHLLIAVDPGVSGGYAVLSPPAKMDAPRRVEAFKWTTMGEVYKHLEALKGLPGQQQLPVAYLEHVTSSPIMGKKACFTFGHNFGQWEAILYAAGFTTKLVKPQIWQRNIPGLSGKQGAVRKKALKTHAERLYPELKVTSLIQDALILMEYVRNL